MTVATKTLVIPFSYSSLIIFLSRLDVCTLCNVVAAEIHEDDVRTVVLHFVELSFRRTCLEIFFLLTYQIHERNDS